MKPLFVALALACLSAGDGKELLQNGGFESGLEGWRPLDMSHTATFELDTKVVASGKQSLRMQRKGQGQSDFLKAVIDLPDTKGKLSFSIAYQVAKDSRVRIDGYFSDAKGETLGKGFLTLVDAKPTKSFEVARQDYAIPKGATQFGINVVMDKPGTAWIDSASVTMLTDAKKAATRKRGDNLLGNGSFDDGVEGWNAFARSAGATKIARDVSTKATGTGSLKLARSSPRLFPEDGVETKAGDLGEALQFQLAFKGRVDAGVRAWVVLQAFDADGIVLATERSPVESPAFAAGSLALKLTEPCDHLLVSYAIGGAGNAWIDDVVLEGK
jgi:hypothetical protein